MLTSVVISGGEASTWNVNDNETTDNDLPTGGVGTTAADGQGAGINDATSDGGSNAFNAGAMFWVDDTQVVGTLTQDGQSVSFAPSTISGLDVQLEYYFDPNSATQRSYLSLMNPTGGSITVDVDYATNFGSDGSTQVENTSSDDTTFTTADRWLVTSDGGLGDPVNTTVISGPGSPEVTPNAVSQTVFSSFGTEGALASYTVTVPAGATRALMTFQQLDDTVADANNEAMDFDANPLPADFTAGLTGGQLARVVNFEFAPFFYQIDGVNDVTLLYDEGSDEVRIVDTANETTILFARDKDDIDGSVFVEGDADDNTLTVDPSYYQLDLDVEFDGGAEVNDPDGDRIIVQGSGTQDAVYTPDISVPLSEQNAGTITVTEGAATSEIYFTNLEPCEITDMATAMFNPPGDDDEIMIEEGMTAAGNFAIVVSGKSDGTDFEAGIFRNIGELTIDTTMDDDGNPADGDDRVDIISAAEYHGITDLTIITGTGDDEVNLLGNLDLDFTTAFPSSDNNEDLRIETQQINLGGGAGIDTITVNDTVSLDAGDGSIVDGGDHTINAVNLVMDATLGIGDAATDGGDIDGNITNLAARTVSGDISVSNVTTGAAFNLTEVDGLSGVTITEATADDDILIRSNQATGGTTTFNVLREVSITPDTGVTAGHITLIQYAQSGVADEMIAEDDMADLNIQANILNMGGGNIELISADDVDIEDQADDDMDDTNDLPLTISTVPSETQATGDIEIHAGRNIDYFDAGSQMLSGADGDIFMDEDVTITTDDDDATTANGNVLLTANDDIILATIDAGDAEVANSGTVYVIADTNVDGTGNENGEGMIIDGTTGEAANITAAAASLRAGSGIGVVEMEDDDMTDDQDIDTSVIDLAATTVSGDISVSNEIITAEFNITEVLGTDFRKFGEVEELAGVTITEALADDDILIRSNQDGANTTAFNVLEEVTITPAVDDGGHITLINYDETTLDIDADITNNVPGDSDDPGNIELFSGGDVDLDVDVDITTDGGDIEIHAGTTTTYFMPAVLSTNTDEYNLLVDTSSTITSDDGNILLTATGNVELSTVDADDGTVYVIADLDNEGEGMIIDDLDSEAANITADSASLRAGSGIGVAEMTDPATDDDDIDTAVTNLAATTITGDISVSNEIAGAAFNITEVLGVEFRKFGEVEDLAGVTITEAVANNDILIRSNESTGGTTIFNVLREVSITPDTGVTAGHITLIQYAQSPMGDGPTLEDDMADLNIQANILNMGGGNIELISADDVDIEDQADDDMDDTNDLPLMISTVASETQATGDIEIHAGRNIDYFDAGTQTLSGADGDIFMDSDVTITTDDDDASTANGNVLLTANDDIVLATIDAGDAEVANSGTVYVIADTNVDGTGSDSGGGMIIDGTTGEDANITAAAASLRAGSGIGVVEMDDDTTDDQDIDTSVIDLAATTVSGDISISNEITTDNFNITEVLGVEFRKFGEVEELAGVTITEATMDDDILIRSNENGADTTAFNVLEEVSITPAVDEGGNITLINFDETTLDIDANITNSVPDVPVITGPVINGNIELYSQGDITIDPAVTVSTTGGNIEAHAGRFVDYFDATGTQGTVGTTANLTMEDGSLIETDGGNALLTAVNNVELSMVDADTGTVYVIADSDDDGTGMISDNTLDEADNITAASASLRAGSGIGAAEMDNPTTDDEDIDTSITNLAATTGSGDISISNEITTDNFNITEVLGVEFRKFGEVDDLSGVTITEGMANDDILVRSNQATVGTTTFNVLREVSITPDTGVTAGHITLIQYAQSGMTDEETAEIDTADLNIQANILNMGGGNIELFSADDVDIEDQDVDGTALTISTVPAETQATGDIEIHAGRNINYFDATAQTLSGADGDIYMDEDVTITTDDDEATTANGNVLLTANDDIELATIDAGATIDASAGTVYVIADTNVDGTGNEDGNGMIIDGTTGEDPNITAAAASLRAGSGIGSGNIAAHQACDDQNPIPDTDIDTSIATLAAVTDSGEIIIENDNRELTIGTVAGTDFRKFGDVDLLSGVTISDDIATGTDTQDSGNDDINIVNGTASLTVAADVTNMDGGVVRLRTGDNDMLILDDSDEEFDLNNSSAADDDIVLQANVTSVSLAPTSNGMSLVFLEAGDDINVPDSVAVQARDGVTFQVDAVDANDMVSNDTFGGVLTIEGDNANVGGNVMGEDITVNLFGNDDNDTLNLDYDRFINVDLLNIDTCDNEDDPMQKIETGASVSGGKPYDQTSQLDVDSNGNPNGMDDGMDMEEGDTVNFDDTDEMVGHIYTIGVEGPDAENRLTRDNAPDTLLNTSVENLNIDAGSADDLLFIDNPVTPDVITFDGGGSSDMDMDGDLDFNEGLDGKDQVIIRGTDMNDKITVGPVGGIMEDGMLVRAPIEIEDVCCLQIEGGMGADQLVNNTGINSIIDGAEGDDILVGGFGRDVLFGGAGADALFGRAGNDFLFSDENMQGQQFNDDGDLLDGGPGLQDAADQQGDDFLRQIEILEDGGGRKSVLMFLRVVIGTVDPDDAFPEIGCFPIILPPTASVDLDPIMNPMTNVNDIDLSMMPTQNRAAFSFTPLIQPGFLTVTATFDVDDGAVSLLLLDDTDTLVGSSAEADGENRIDLEITDTGNQYTVILVGDNSDVDLTITNAITQNSPLTIHGTEGDDVVSITTGNEAMQIVYNGVPYEFANSSTESVTFLGNGGVDSFTVDGIASTQFEVHGPGSTTLTGSPTVIHTAGVETINYRLQGSAAQTYTSSELETFNWRNEANPHDVNASGLVTINDALLIVSEIRRGGIRDISHTDPGATPNYYDTNGDGMLTIADALLVVSELRDQASAGEAEAFAANSSSTAEGEAPAKSSVAIEQEAPGAASYEALLAEQTADEDDDELFSASAIDELELDSIADDIAAAWEG